MTIQSFMPIDRLDALALELASQYAAGSPFPHIVIDNFLGATAFSVLAGAFPGPQHDIWYKFKSGKENLKLQSRELDDLPWEFRLFFNEANGPRFTRFLEQLTGISGLVPDPHLHGGGLHQTLPGGHLGVHVDYNFHKEWALDRRLNAIIYFNETWDPNWGGALELWDESVKNRVQDIQPVGNRLVVFSTDEKSWHGHPDPLRCPEGRTRRSAALYYYTNGRPEEETALQHNTIFHERPGEVYRLTMKEKIRDVARKISFLSGGV